MKTGKVSEVKVLHDAKRVEPTTSTSSHALSLVTAAVKR